MAVIIHLDVQGIPELQSRLKAGDQRLVRAVQRVINDAARAYRTEASKEIRRNVLFKVSYLNSEGANGPRFGLLRATGEELRAVVYARERRTRVDRFNPRQLYARSKRTGKRIRAGVSFHIKRASGRKSIKQAFLVPLREGRRAGEGGLGVAVRLSVLRNEFGSKKISDKGGLKKFGPDRAYAVLHTTSVNNAFEDAQQVIKRPSESRLRAALYREIRFQFRRRA